MEPSVGPIRVIDRADTAVVAQLGREIATFNMATVGVPDGRELFALLRDERGALVAGLDGWTWAGTGWIEHLWVRSENRRRGLGGALLAAAEREARERDCMQLGLCTHSFQAPAFYRRHGFDVTGELPDYPTGHSFFLMRKVLE
jgi:ribosomal protein S18 acetylase RimI-like enzyme